LQSKTFWIAVGTVAGAVSQVVPPQYAVVLGSVAQVINRFYTDRPVHVV
jgi:hypothetical protein